MYSQNRNFRYGTRLPLAPLQFGGFKDGNQKPSRRSYIDLKIMCESSSINHVMK